MTLFWKTVLLAGVTVFSSCMKEKTQPIVPPVTSVPAGQMKMINWDNGLAAYLDYKADGKLNSIQYILGNSTGTTRFEWTGDKMTSLSDEGSGSKNNYTYLSDGRVESVQNVQTGGGSSGWSLDYTYKPDGKLDSLKYFTMTQGVKTLKASTGYNYDSGGELTEVLTLSGGNQIRQVVDSWSQAFVFTPQLYLETNLSDVYTIFNLPVLAQVSRLPAKITRTVKLGAAAFKTDKIQETIYTVTDGKLTASKTTLTFPEIPSSNSVVNAQYVYQP